MSMGALRSLVTTDSGFQVSSKLTGFITFPLL